MSRKLLDSIAEERAVDLIQAYAHEVPSLVISELLGVPIEHRDRLTMLSGRVSRLLGTGNGERGTRTSKCSLGWGRDP
ncbi:MAG TPA: hypothetical protein EYQ60_04135 [Myxococcales bacterium]|nr:hypothetical protein [Myxococcales bacterium]HIK84258.1 hypothetical protein [Myxococcales bacterium]